MTNLKFIYRADATNVGDWWCPPFRYFPFKPGPVGDILDESFAIGPDDTLIMGGGGIGSEFFRPHLDRIRRARPLKTIVWGAGIDAVADKKKLLAPSNYDLYSDYFDGFDEVGLRVHSEPQKFRYVPCASCMNNLLFKYREAKPSQLLGFYNHKRVALSSRFNGKKVPFEDNSGSDLEPKLQFLSSFEYIVTNTYHGVYWATLLGRKVVVIPFKSGLLSFKHKPVYSWDGNLSEDMLHAARAYPGALEEARALNLRFYKDLSDKYDIV